MPAIRIIVLSLITGSGVMVLAAQTPLGKDGADLRAHLALQALDRYLETWNSRDAGRWASSLNVPDVRPGPGAFELFRTPAQYVASVTFARRDRTGQLLSTDEAVFLVVRRGDAWRVQAVSTPGT